MTSPRLLVYAVMAMGSALLPTTAAAALVQDDRTTPVPVGYPQDGDGNTLWTNDNVVSPGDEVKVNFLLRDDFSPNGYDDSGLGTVFPGNSVGVSPTANNPFRARGSNYALAQDADGTPRPFTLTLPSANSLTCGTRVPLRLQLAGPSFGGAGYIDYNYGLPTGAPGAFRRTASTDVGNIIYDGGNKESVVSIARGADLAKDLRIHIDLLEHRFSTHWLKITLVSPSGKEALLFDQVGTVQGPDITPTKHLKNVTFSSRPVDGQAPVNAEDAINADFTDQVIEPEVPFSVFDGEPLTGDWKLRVQDISAPLESRRLKKGGGRAFAYEGNQMAQLGEWQIDTAGAICSADAQASGPDAWFGDDPLILDPAGATVDGGNSVDTSYGGSVVKWEWDLDGNESNGFETTVTSGPTVNLPGPLPQGKRNVRLRVTDDSGKVSSATTREVIISKRPVISGITANPSTVVAGTPVQLTAAATDEDLPENAALSYAWDLDDDGLFDDATGHQITKTWPASGLQPVRLKVTDQVGAFAILNDLVNVSNLPPVAKFTVGASPVIVGEPVTFDGSVSTDADGTIVNYDWDLNGDGTYGDLQGEEPKATYTFSKPGVTTVRLRVKDNTGGYSDPPFELAIDVTGRPVPVGTASPESPLKGETVTFNASGSYDSDSVGSIVKYEWDLDGNGTYEINGPTAVTAQKSYPNAGTVSVKLQVTDNAGAKGLQIIPVIVRNPPPPVVVTPTTPVKTTPPPTNGGGGDPVPTPVPEKGPGGEPTPPTLKEAPPAIVVPVGEDWTAEKYEDAPDAGQTESGYAAALGMSSKAKAKKVYKKGIAVKLTANDASTLVLKAMISVKDAKALGLKIKKPTAIGSGKLALKKSGSGKVTVVFAKKYQRYVKKAKKTPLTFSALVTSGTTKEQIVLAKKITLVK